MAFRHWVLVRWTSRGGSIADPRPPEITSRKVPIRVYSRPATPSSPERDVLSRWKTTSANISQAFPARGTNGFGDVSIDVTSDTGMCSDGEAAATGNTALRIAANIAG